VEHHRDRRGRIPLGVLEQVSGVLQQQSRLTGPRRPEDQQLPVQPVGHRGDAGAGRQYLVGLAGLGPYKWVSDARVVIPALAVVDTWEWTPLITLITLAGLATLPIEPYESALIDGASSAQMFWRITLPLLRPTIVVALLFRAIDCLKTFDIIYVMTQGGPGFASETLNVYTFQVGLFYFHIGYASSLLVILFTLVLGVSLLLIKVRRGT